MVKYIANNTYMVRKEEEALQMEYTDYFPFWKKLTIEQQNKITESTILRSVKKGTVLHRGSMDCAGLMLIEKGQLRAYILSEEGREVSLYRLFDMDICLLSAPCIINSIQFEITIEAEKDSEIWMIPSKIYKELMEESVLIANYTNQLMASRFSEVMWLIEQVMWKSFDRRLAAFLLEEISLEGSDTLKITHERIGSHLGTAREVVTRMLSYFQKEGFVRLSRGTVEITNRKGLESL